MREFLFYGQVNPIREHLISFGLDRAFPPVRYFGLDGDQVARYRDETIDFQIEIMPDLSDIAAILQETEQVMLQERSGLPHTMCEFVESDGIQTSVSVRDMMEYAKVLYSVDRPRLPIMEAGKTALFVDEKRDDIGPPITHVELGGNKVSALSIVLFESVYYAAFQAPPARCRLWGVRLSVRHVLTSITSQVEC